MRVVRVKRIIEGEVEGSLTLYLKPISFLGEVNPEKGLLKKNNDYINIKNSLLVFPYSRGSTVGSYVIYALKYYGNSPKACIVMKADPILIAGCALSKTPLAVLMEVKDLTELQGYRKASLQNNELLLFP